MRLPRLVTALALACSAALAGCEHIDDNRIPPSPVYVQFTTIGDWQIYGVSGAGLFRYFIKPERQPAGYPYTAVTATGFGGVLLVGDIHGEPVAYDLACPVECRSDVRVRVIEDNLTAECPICHSVYDIASAYGYPLSGPAARDGYGLQRYYVHPGSNGIYRVITR